MEVIGEDGMVYETLDGYGGPMEDYEEVQGDVLGYDDDGNEIVVGAPRRRIVRARKRVPVRQPRWRKTQLAPGVIAPDQGMVPLPMTASAAAFSATVPEITWSGVLQKPFRGERLLTSVVRTGTTATGRVLGRIFVGTDLAQADIGAFDLESVGDPNAFGIRLTMKPAEPGVWIRIIGTATPAPTSTDTISFYITLLGRIIA
jgi:hypothetical protein